MAKRKAEWQNNYIARTYDRINLTIPKGKKDVIQAHADSHNESVNGFINRAIDETMQRDRETSAPNFGVSGTERRIAPSTKPR